MEATDAGAHHRPDPMHTFFTLLKVDPASGHKSALPYRFETSAEAGEKVAELQAAEPEFRFVVQVVAA